MKKLFLIFPLVINSIAFAQEGSKHMKDMHKEIERQMRSLDSLKVNLDSQIIKMGTFSDSAARAKDIEQNNRNLDAIMTPIHEKDRQVNRRIYWRIVFGLALLCIGIYGVFRKRKKNTS